MNSNVKFVAGLIIGAVSGVICTYIYDKKRFDKLIQAELKKEMDAYKARNDEKEAENEEISEKIDYIDEKITKTDDFEPFEEEKHTKSYLGDNSIDENRFKRERGDYTDYENVLNDEDYDSVDGSEMPIAKHWEDLNPDPYIFDPEDGYIPENYSDYDHVMVFFDPTDYATGCVTELGEEMEDVDAKLGFNNLEVLHQMIDECDDLRNNAPVIHIRNERMGMEYEVTFGPLPNM